MTTRKDAQTPASFGHCFWCADAELHYRRPVRSYIGFVDPDDLARVLYIDTPRTEVPPPLSPPPPPVLPADTWVPDLVNVELKAN